MGVNQMINLDKIIPLPRFHDIKKQYLPKNKALKILYIGLWIIDPAFMTLILAYQIYKNKKDWSKWKTRTKL